MFKPISKQTVNLVDDCIYYGFIDLDKINKYRKNMYNPEGASINSKIIIGNLIISYHWGDDDELLSLNCYDIKNRKIFDWNWPDYLCSRVPLYNIEYWEELNTINEYLKNCIYQQDCFFFVKQYIRRKISTVANIFYVNLVPKSRLRKISRKIYRTLWDINVNMNFQLQQKGEG